jgi:hypothetical protein
MLEDFALDCRSELILERAFIADSSRHALMRGLLGSKLDELARIPT